MDGCDTNAHSCQNLGCRAFACEQGSGLCFNVWQHAWLAVWSVILINKTETWEKPEIVDTEIGVSGSNGGLFRAHGRSPLVGCSSIRGAMMTRLYRFLTEEILAFCHKVTKPSLRAGNWKPKYTFDSNLGQLRCGQAVTKVIDAPMTRRGLRQ